MSVSLFFNNVAFKRLNPFLISLYNLVIDRDIISGTEIRIILFAGHLLVYVCDGVHNADFTLKGEAKVALQQLLSKSVYSLQSTVGSQFTTAQHILFWTRKCRRTSTCGALALIAYS